MKKKKLASLIALILAAALGLVFVVSAYAKTMPISYFEYVVDSQLGLGTTWSAIAARLLIGLEAAIGLLLIFQLWGRNYWVLKMGLLLLVLFSLHLIVLWATVGNNVNCGCMGNQIYLSPVQSLLKNTVLIIGFLTVWILIRVSTKNELEPKKNPKDSNPQNNNYHWITILVSILLMGIPFFVFPITNKLALPVSKLASAEGIHPSGT